MENSNLLYFTLKSILTESNEVKQKINSLKKGDILVLIKDLDKIKVATEDGVHLGFVPDIFFELISKSMTHDMASSIIDSIDNNIDSPSISLIYNFDNMIFEFIYVFDGLVSIAFFFYHRVFITH